MIDMIKGVPLAHKVTEVTLSDDYELLLTFLTVV